MMMPISRHSEPSCSRGAIPESAAWAGPTTGLFNEILDAARLVIPPPPVCHAKICLTYSIEIQMNRIT
jgi:hypothetical protein